MDKIFNSYQMKTHENLDLSIKDIDQGSRKVSMYLSRFDVMDSDNDIIRKGAFKKSIQERGPMSSSNRKIAFLRYHNWEMPIGKFLELNEDDSGLYAVAQLGISTDAMNALADYQEGIIKEHSIGFRYVKDKIKFIEDDSMDSKGFYEVSEDQLFEGSAVTFGANEFTNVIEVAKSEGVQDIALKIHDEINMITKSLANGKGTDERLYNMEMRLKFLNARMLDLTKMESFDKSSIKSESSADAPGFDWSKVGSFYHKETYKGYPQSAINNAKKGIRLNEEVGNKCATNIGKQRARDIVANRAFSLETLNRVYSYLSRAKEYYNPNDEKACGTISYLLWGGESMRVWSEKKLAEINNNN